MIGLGQRRVLPASWPNPLEHSPLAISADVEHWSVTGPIHSAQVIGFERLLWLQAKKFYGPL